MLHIGIGMKHIKGVAMSLGVFALQMGVCQNITIYGNCFILICTKLILSKQFVFELTIGQYLRLPIKARR